ncbi:MAG TPA: cytochrome c [Longimicrobium sp.]|nr:cytochrome c [Longimicrobium sp.]
MRKGQWRGVAAALALAAVAACGGDRARDGRAPGGRTEVAGDSGPPPGQLPQGVTAEQGGQGRRLYREACVMCHGEGGGGTQLGPSLVDGEWAQGDGGFDAITQVVRDGVAEPRDFPVPMPPRGNGGFDDARIRAVAAYTYSLARRQQPAQQP